MASGRNKGLARDYRGTSVVEVNDWDRGERPANVKREGRRYLRRQTKRDLRDFQTDDEVDFQFDDE